MPDVRIDAAGFAQLAEELFAADTPAETADQVVALVQQELDVDSVGITMIRSDRGLETIASTDPVAHEADVLQVELREGPCMDASWHRQTLLSQNLATDPRWPQWAPKAAALGVSSLLAVELSSPERRIGALNLFSARPRDFSDDDIAFAYIFARHAALAISVAEHDAHLVVALDARKLIGQAQGILMERYGLDAGRAFEVLKRYSQDHNVKLRQVATELVETRRLPDDVREPRP
ncbi:MAG: ANTAR domain-containing protein [Nocardioidaceae bacterium]